MNKKTVLIGITAGALMITTLATAFGDRKNIATFAENNPQGTYTAVIDSSNRLKATSSEGRFVFKLHGGSEYGYMYVSSPTWLNINPTGKYSDYAFSWENTDGTSKYFEIFLRELAESSFYTFNVDGKNCFARGFPGAFRITTVFSNPNKISVDESNPYAGWKCSRSTDEETGLTTDVATINVSVQPSDNHIDWCSREAGTIYIKSITIEYTC